MGMQWPLASSGCPAGGLSSAPATLTKLMGAAFPPHAEEKHPWDTLPCVGLRHIQAGACECRGKAGGEQPFPDPCPSGLLMLFGKTNSRGACMGKWDVGLRPPLP